MRLKKLQNGGRPGGDPVYPKEITSQSLADYLTRTRSLPGAPYDFRAAADTIAAHESAFTMDPKLKQYGGGPGRGVYQFEPAAAKTASNRLRQLADIFGVSNPDWNRGVSDVSKLSREQQDVLFFADKIMAPDADSRALAEGRIPLSQFWAEGHYRGPKKEERMMEFERTRRALQQKGFAGGGRVGRKIKVLKKEGRPHDQAVAIALSMRDRGEL